MNKELINLIPKMTSDSDPSGKVQCSSTWNGRYGYLAFDGNSETMWTNSNGEAFISYTFDKPVKINIIKIIHGTSSIRKEYIYWNKIDIYGDNVLLTTINKTDMVEAQKICIFEKRIQHNKKYQKYTFKFDTSSYTYISSIHLSYISDCKYLLKQDNQYYTVKSSLYRLGQPSNNEELETWYKEYGIDDLNLLVEKKNSKLVDLKLDKNNTYKTDKNINFNEVTDDIEYIDEDNKKKIKYNVEEYQLLDLIKEKIGSKFQIAKWEEK